MVKRNFHFLLALFLMVIFPAFIWAVGVFLDVDTLDVTDRIVSVDHQGAAAVYRLALPAPAEGKRYEIMFEASGCTVEITSDGQMLYAFGQETAARGGMIGTVYVHAFLPDGAYGAPLQIRLTAAGSNASMRLDKIELCPQEDNLRYYITNKTLGLPMAMVLVSMAFAIPEFLLLGNARRLLYEGLLFGCMLLCFSVLLLSDGGHFLVFFPNQQLWWKVSYLAGYLLPLFFLSYFCIQEKGKKQRHILLTGAAVHFLFVAVAAWLGLTERVHFCDLKGAFNAVLILDALVGLYELFCSFRKSNVSRVRKLVMVMAVVWVGFIVVSNLLSAWVFPQMHLPNFRLLELGAVFLFFVLCYLFADSAFRIQRDAEHTERTALSATAFAQAMSENYESIYSVDLESGAYTHYFEGTTQGRAETRLTGDNFFTALENKLPQIVAEQDRDHVMRRLSRDAVIEGTRENRHYTLIYRAITPEGERYHQIRAVRRMVGGKEWILLGIHDIDAAMRLEKQHEEQRESMLQKEANHMEAILASSQGYMEANLTQDTILESFYHREGEDARLPVPGMKSGMTFSDFSQWWAEHMVVENQKKFRKINNRDRLLQLFARGERRASVFYSNRGPEGEKQPCRQIFYLYRDKASDDVMCFYVVYDLTEQQKKEKEMQELEDQLRMSRIRVFTGQMQPHFLYNALGSIQEIVLYDPEYASELIGDFTTHLRGSIRAMATDDPIPFAQEMENIRAYVNIERMRFGEKLKVRFDIQTEDFSILPLSIQPLVENAIRHGIYERGPRGGQVTVRSREQEDNWQVQVEDDGVGFDTARVLSEENYEESESAGLKNVVFRLEKVMHARVDIRSVPDKGTCITVTIPKEEKQ